MFDETRGESQGSSRYLTILSPIMVLRSGMNQYSSPLIPRISAYMEVSINGVTQELDGLWWKLLLKWMLKRYPYFRNPHIQGIVHLIIINHP